MSEYHRWAPAWMQRDDLPCQRVPSWFEPEGWRDSSLKVRRARRECATCPARPECLLWALTETFDVVVPRYDQESGHLAVDRLEHHVRESRSILAGSAGEDALMAGTILGIFAVFGLLLGWLCHHHYKHPHRERS